MSELRELDQSHFEEIRTLFRDVFMSEPWNEDWSDDRQLDEYLKDLMGARTPVILGLYENEKLTGVSIGNIRHWCGGTEYHIEELFIRKDMQKKGYGTVFLEKIEEWLKEHGIHQIFLMTERNVPAYDFYRKLGFEEIPEHVSFFREF